MKENQEPKKPPLLKIASSDQTSEAAPTFDLPSAVRRSTGELQRSAPRLRPRSKTPNGSSPSQCEGRWIQTLRRSLRSAVVTGIIRPAWREFRPLPAFLLREDGTRLMSIRGPGGFGSSGRCHGAPELRGRIRIMSRPSGLVLINRASSVLFNGLLEGLTHFQAVPDTNAPPPPSAGAPVPFSGPCHELFSLSGCNLEITAALLRSACSETSRP